MPRNAIAAGCVDFVLSPENIAKELGRIARHPYAPGQPLTPALSPSKRKKLEVSAEKGTGQNGFQKILLLLRNHSGVDFSLYKSKTVHRRIARRMLLNKIDRPQAYATFLRGNPRELEALYSDMLINVTSFFRNPEAFEVLKTKVDTQREADRVTLNRFAPPSVLIDAQLQVLQFRGDTSLFLKPPSGNASFQVLKMAREGLMLPLRAAIKKVKEENKTVRREGVRVAQNRGTRTVNFEVVPLTHLKERCCLIFFEEAKKGGLQTTSASEVGQVENISGTDDRLRAKRKPDRAQPQDAKRKPDRWQPQGTKGRAPESRRVAELERALAENRDYTQSLQEQHEAANEELQAANEEVTSANEELQSINEELETSKEELESANEELTTVNDEMVHRNAELNRANADLNNLHTSVNMAILLLTRDRRDFVLQLPQALIA